MRLTSTEIEGAYVIDVERVEDSRGYFERIFCKQKFGKAGLISEFVQQSISHNNHERTLRGMHFQSRPMAETKLVSCIRGSIYDVVVDMRTESPTFLKWFGIKLRYDDGRFVYLPEGCAHGFMTLSNDSDVLYSMTAPYDQNLARGFRWDDAVVGIVWPQMPSVISDRDRQLPSFTEALKNL